MLSGPGDEMFQDQAADRLGVAAGFLGQVQLGQIRCQLGDERQQLTGLLGIELPDATGVMVLVAVRVLADQLGLRTDY